jgi:hypothetical protein
MTARPYTPSGLTDAGGHPKAPHELVEYSSTIFDTSLDDADRKHTVTVIGRDFVPPPDQERARKMADYAVRLMRSKGDHLALMRKHIASLDLSLPRLVRLNRFARSNVLPYFKCAPDAGIKEPGITWGEWRAASQLVHRAALSILLDVPARNASDAMVLAELVREALEAPEKAQQRRVAKRLARYFSLMLASVYRLSGPQQFVGTVQNDMMEPGYMKGTRIIYQRCRGELVPGVDYIFRSRGNDIEMIRRFSHLTPTGRWSVEIFKGPDGRPSRQNLEPSSWRPAYRILRHVNGA